MATSSTRLGKVYLAIAISFFIAALNVFLLSDQTGQDADVKAGDIIEKDGETYIAVPCRFLDEQSTKAKAALKRRDVLEQMSDSSSELDDTLEKLYESKEAVMNEQVALWEELKKYSTASGVASISYISLKQLNKLTPEMVSSFLKVHGAHDDLIKRIPAEWNSKQLKRMSKGRQALVGVIASSLVAASLENSEVNTYEYWIILALVFVGALFLWGGLKELRITK